MFWPFLNRYQTVILTNGGLQWLDHWQYCTLKIFIKNAHFVKNISWKMSSANWPSFCLGPSVLGANHVRTTYFSKYRPQYHGPLARYANLLVVHAPGMPGTSSPPPTSKETAGSRSRHASGHVWSRTCRDASRDRWPVVAGKAFPAHAQPVILCIWQEAHYKSNNTQHWISLLMQPHKAFAKKNALYGQMRYMTSLRVYKPKEIDLWYRLECLFNSFYHNSPWCTESYEHFVSILF